MENFSTLGLSQPVLDAVRSIGYEKPTPVQAMVIPKLLKESVDLVGLAQTGTGKTAAFGLPLIDMIDPGQSATQALILAPTRELTLQIREELLLFAKNVPRLNIVAVYGGADIYGQIRQLNKGAQLIVATPGRLKDMMNRKKVDLSHIRFLVLDEADEMLNMGFRDDLDFILEGTPGERRTFLFSATMSPEVQRISRKYMKDPFEVTVGQRNTSNENIDHQYIALPPVHKYEALRRLMDFHPDFFGLIFVRTRTDARELALKLIADGYHADALHGDLSQSQRDLVMERFRSGSLRAVVATDVAARGLDVNNITHVVHFNIAEDPSFYTHRSGRTGRAGKKGVSIVLMHPKDMPRLKAIERHVKIRFEAISVPSGEEICRRHLKKSLQDMKNAGANESFRPFLPLVHKELADLSREELIERIAAYSFSGMLDRYGDLPDLNRPKGPEKVRFKGTRLFINVGRVDEMDKGEFLKLICEHVGITSASIGQIDLQHTYTYFHVEDSVVKTVIDKFHDTYMEGRKLRVNPADYKPSPKKKEKGKDKKFQGRKPERV
jgi:ATP-dependent RNA helicase DeaD